MGKTATKKGEKENNTVAAKCKLLFPYGRTMRLIRRHVGKGARVAAPAVVGVAAVLEYVTAEVMELGAQCARDHKRVQITPRDLMMAIRRDTELNKLFERHNIAHSGFMVHIDPVLVDAVRNRKRRPRRKAAIDIPAPKAPAPRKTIAAKSAATAAKHRALKAPASAAPQGRGRATKGLKAPRAAAAAASAVAEDDDI